VLVVLASGGAATVSSAVFALSAVLLFGISGTYHRFSWKPGTKKILRRLDHANIFILIAGTYTPIAVMALPSDKGMLLLAAVWAGALIGIGLRVFWLTAPRWVYVPLYLGLGWAAVMYLQDLLAANFAMMVLVIVGGLAYSLGAVIYGLKWPNPSPKNFGFHEIFHVLTVVAYMSHWTAVLLVAMNPPMVG
jgi:hemolysin III